MNGAFFGHTLDFEYGLSSDSILDEELAVLGHPGPIVDELVDLAPRETRASHCLVFDCLGHRERVSATENLHQNLNLPLLLLEFLLLLGDQDITIRLMRVTISSLS